MRSVLEGEFVEAADIDVLIVGFLGKPPLRDEVIDVLAKDGLIAGDGKCVGEDSRVGGDAVAHVLVIDLGEMWHTLDDDGAPAEGLAHCVMSCNARPCPLSNRTSETQQ